MWFDGDDNNAAGSAYPTTTSLAEAASTDDLEAILSILEDDETLASAMNDQVTDASAWLHSNAASSPSNSGTESTTRPRGRRQRKESGSSRVRAEIMQLRSLAKDLEDQLALMRHRALPGNQVNESAVQAEVDGNHQVQTIWKSIAKRQFVALKEARQLNESLKASMEEERKVMRQFMRSLNRGSSKLESKHHGPESAVRRSIPPIRNVVDYDEGVDAATCDQLLEQLDDMLKTVDIMFQDPCFSSTDTVSRKTQTSSYASIMVLDSRIVPFDHRGVSDAIWDYYAARTTEPTKFPHMEEVGDNLMVKGFQMTHRLATFQVASFEGIVVARRVRDGDRSIMVWAATVTPTVNVGGIMPPVEMTSFEAKGWNVVYPVPGSSGALSKINMNHCVQPANREVCPRPLRGVVSEMLRRLVGTGVSEHQDMVHRRVDDTFISGSATSSGNQLFTDVDEAHFQELFT